MHRPLSFLTAIGFALIVQGLSLTIARADTYTINSDVRDWYESTGIRDGTDHNYFVGGLDDGDATRNYFVFTLPNFTGTIVSAQLILNNPATGFFSTDSTETYVLYNVSTGITTLTTEINIPTGLQVYNDLGSGTSYGSITVGSSSNGTNISISLNSDFFAAALGAQGSQFAIGGALTTLDPSRGEYEYIFGNTGSSVDSDVQLVVTTVPEPSACGLLLAGGGAALYFRRLRKR